MGTTYEYQMEAPVTGPPQRVVSLVPSVTESLFDLNVGDRLIGITHQCIYPESGVANLPRLGGVRSPDIARISSLRPDLVIVNAEENRAEDIEALQQAGVPVWVTFPKTVSEAINLLWNIMHIFDEASMVPRVRLIEQTMDWVGGMSRANEDHHVRTFVPVWPEPLMTFNRDTYTHDLLQICGGDNVFASHQQTDPLPVVPGQTEGYPVEQTKGFDARYPHMTLEDVTAAQPEVVLLPGSPYGFDEAHIPMFAGLDIPAAHQGRIHLVDGSLLMWHGTRLAHALNTIPALLLPQVQP